MPKKSMKEIRALAKKKIEGREKKRSYNPDVYPFWNIKEGETATIRFLPDKNPDNDFPFIERLDHRISIDGKTKTILCPKTELFGGTKCPICERSAEYYDAGDEKSGKYYYRDATHLAKALVLSDPLPPDPQTGETYEGKVVTIRLGYQLFTKILEDLGNVFDDDDSYPWDLEEGYNFNLKKTINKGGKAKWDTSSYFDRKPSPIPDKYLENIELVDLTTLLEQPLSYDEINELLAKHLSGSTDDDNLETKKSASPGTSSKRAEMLARLRGGVEEESDDDFEDVPDFENSHKNVMDEDDDDDDDDEDISDLRAMISRKKKS